MVNAMHAILIYRLALQKDIQQKWRVYENELLNKHENETYMISNMYKMSSM